MAVKVEDQARVGCAIGLQLGQHGLYVPQIVGQLGDDNVIECSGAKIQFMRICEYELQMRMSRACFFQSFWAEINAYPF